MTLNALKDGPQSPPVSFLLLTPRVPAIKALRIVNTENLTALRAAPPFFFAFNEMPYAEILYVLEIVDHAHDILGSIPLIQMVQPVARKAVTIEAVLDFCVHDFLAVFDLAHDAGYRFEAVLAPATGARLLISCV